MKIDKEKMNKKMSKLKEETSKLAKKTERKTKELTSKTKEIAIASKNKISHELDANGDGNIDIQDIIILGLRTPGIKVDRSEFLSKELSKNYSPEVIDKAIKTTPMKAGIDKKEIDKIADEVIKFERTCVSGISAALGAPGGLAMAATLPADIIQYYGYMLRVSQKLLYLYGFQEIKTEEKGQVFDSETLNILTICLGVMYGVAGANHAIKAMANGLAKGISKKIMATALTKGTIYPIVKKTMKWFGVSLTKKMLSGTVSKSLPVVGGVVSGGLTFATFKPCCDKLKKSLQDTMLSNPSHKEDKEVIDILEKIDNSNKLNFIEKQ